MLAQDCEPRFFFFELFEMMRRFLLVGVAVIVQQGSLIQSILAVLISLLYLVIQLQMGPYIHLSDDFVALASSFSLTVLFLCCLILKISALTELQERLLLTTPTHCYQLLYYLLLTIIMCVLQEVKERMSEALQASFLVPADVIAVIIFVSVVLALAFTAFVVAVQVEAAATKYR